VPHGFVDRRISLAWLKSHAPTYRDERRNALRMGFIDGARWVPVY
jgi:hypothetical protein